MIWIIFAHPPPPIPLCPKIWRDSITWLIWRTGNRKFQKLLLFYEHKVRWTELIYTRQKYCIVLTPEVYQNRQPTAHWSRLIRGPLTALRLCSAFHKHSNSQLQKPPSQLCFPLLSIIITITSDEPWNRETQNGSKSTNHKPWPFEPVK